MLPRASLLGQGIWDLEKVAPGDIHWFQELNLTPSPPWASRTDRSPLLIKPQWNLRGSSLEGSCKGGPWPPLFIDKVIGSGKMKSTIHNHPARW